MSWLPALRDFIRPLSVTALIGMLILGALVTGVLEAIAPGRGVAFATGVAGWFRAIPDSYYQLTGVVLFGYTAARSVEKVIPKIKPPGRSRPDNPDRLAAGLPRMRRS